MLKRLDLRPRANAAGIHLLISAPCRPGRRPRVLPSGIPGRSASWPGAATCSSSSPSVDVVIGPVLTFAVFNRAKGARHLAATWRVIGCCRSRRWLRPAHGLHRPAGRDGVRGRALPPGHRQRRHVESCRRRLPEFRELSLDRPTVIGRRRPEPGAERNDAMFMGVSGIDVGQRPMFWQPYPSPRPGRSKRIQAGARLCSNSMRTRLRTREQRLAEMKRRRGQRPLPSVMARQPWVAVLDKTGALLGYLPLDGFFLVNRTFDAATPAAPSGYPALALACWPAWRSRFRP
jgi:hypothetical protein